MYPGLWRHAVGLAKSQGMIENVDMLKLEKAVEEKTGVPTYVMPGPEPPSALPPTTETASSMPLPPPGSAATAPDADSSVGGASMSGTNTDTDSEGDTGSGTDKAAPAIPPRAPAIPPRAAAIPPRAATISPRAAAILPPAAAIPPPPPFNAIRTAPSAASAATENNEGDVDTSGASDEGLAPSAASVPAVHSGNGAGTGDSGADDAPAADDASQWQRLPDGAMPVE